MTRYLLILSFPLLAFSATAQQVYPSDPSKPVPKPEEVEVLQPLTVEQQKELFNTPVADRKAWTPSAEKSFLETCTVDKMSEAYTHSYDCSCLMQQIQAEINYVQFSNNNDHFRHKIYGLYGQEKCEK